MKASQLKYFPALVAGVSRNRTLQDNFVDLCYGARSRKHMTQNMTKDAARR